MPAEALKPVHAATPPVRAAFDVDLAIEPFVVDALTALDGRAPLLAGMVRYHLGYLDADFTPASAQTLTTSRGKRLRPAIALLSAGAVGGEPRTAAPIAAALELLHNFTLIHDDIQDKSETRRHRPTVWKLWGFEQAINAGDALFAVAHLPFARLRGVGVSPDVIVELIEAFNRTTISIVEGQVLDLEFEGQTDVTPDAYLEMISRKTAAIVRFAAWAGAVLGGASRQTASGFADFGLGLGLGYQIRDDALGIWGAPGVTGKATADDIRRRKQSLPIVTLRTRANAAENAELTSLYSRDHVDEHGVATVLRLLETYSVAAEIERQVDGSHTQARTALVSALGSVRTPASDALFELVDQMALRDA